MRNTRVARRYAAALMSVAEEQAVIERVAADAALILHAFRGSRDLRIFLASPVISARKKQSAISEIFGARIDKVTASFIAMMITKQRENLLGEVMEQYETLRDEKEGIVNVDVRSAVALSAPQVEKLQTELQRYTRMGVRVRHTLAPELRGGLQFRVGDTVVDASVKRQLELMRERFVG